MRLAAVVLLAAGALALVACSPSRSFSWHDQLKPDSPCYEVDLLDGLDRSSTGELQTAFECLNLYGHLEPLVPTSRALDRPVANGTPVGLALADAVTAASQHEVDLGTLLDTATDALRSPDQPLQLILDLMLELAYGRPAPDLRAPDAPLRDVATLSAAPLHAAAPLANLAGRALSENPEVLEAVAELLSHDDTPRWVYTIEAFVEARDDRLRQVVADLPRDLGDALLATSAPLEDPWAGSSGNRLRDAARVFLAGDAPLLGVLAPDLHAILADRGTIDGFEDGIVRWYDDGHLLQVPSQVAWVASVDREGRPLRAGEPSALTAFLRLLRDANRPMRCSVDLGITEFSVDLGNFSLTFLDVLADQDASTLMGASGLLSDVLDFPLTAIVLDQVASSGVCPVLTPQLLDDVAAVEVLREPDAEALLVVFLDMLRILRDEGDDHLRELADAASKVVDAGALPPLEPLLRDLGPQPLMAHIVELAPALARPARWAIRHPKTIVVDLADALNLLDALVAPRDEGPGIGWQRWAPLAEPLLLDQALWNTLDSAAPLLSSQRSVTSGMAERLPLLLSLDPDLTSLGTAADLVADERVTGPLVAVLAEGSLVAELSTPRATGDDPRVPVAYLAELVTDGTLDDLLALMDLALDAMGQTPPTP